MIDDQMLNGPIVPKSADFSQCLANFLCHLPRLPTRPDYLNTNFKVHKISEFPVESQFSKVKSFKETRHKYL